MLLEASWQAAATLLAEHRDVLEARPNEGETPRALAERNWAPYLLSLEDVAVERLETGGADAEWPAGAPPSFLALVAAVRATCRIPSADKGKGAPPRPPKRFEKPRKHAQIEAFARVVTPLAAKAKRVVDVGSGHGHLARDLAERLGVPVLGLERDAELARKARALAKGMASFAIVDVLARGLALGRGDCVVGLHACGELGDVMVEGAARAGASIALVGCCLQKRRSLSRASLVTGDVPIDLPKSVLGLSNLTARDDGVEASRAENLRARERRVALHRLLREAGIELPLGAEIEGLNRRTAHATIDILVARAFASRNLTMPSAVAIDTASRWASFHHARMRRLALPRSLLGRLLEVFVLLDRARYLETCGFDVTVGVLFPVAVSARNLVLAARPR